MHNLELSYVTKYLERIFKSPSINLPISKQFYFISLIVYVRKLLKIKLKLLMSSPNFPML